MSHAAFISALCLVGAVIHALALYDVIMTQRDPERFEKSIAPGLSVVVVLGIAVIFFASALEKTIGYGQSLLFLPFDLVAFVAALLTPVRSANHST